MHLLVLSVFVCLCVCVIFGLSTDKIIPPLNRNKFTSFSFSCLIAWAITANFRLNKSGEFRRPCFVSLLYPGPPFYMQRKLQSIFIHMSLTDRVCTMQRRCGSLAGSKYQGRLGSGLNFECTPSAWK